VTKRYPRQQVTPAVHTETTLRGCNPSFVLTSAGPVVIDTPQLPTRAIAMRKAVEQHGPVQYVINTEHHVDHIFGNYYFKGAGQVVHHQGVYYNFMTVYPELDPFEYAREAIPTDDPEGAALFPGRDEYYADPTRGRSCSPATSPRAQATIPSTFPHPGTHQGRSRCTCPRSGWFSPATLSSPDARPG
jgi:glyoxylase-like metal-dependent hydrolase (beta-lactamase superfamily II)